MSEPTVSTEPKPRHQGLWLRAPELLTFPTDRLDVWKINLDAEDVETAILSSDEIARVGRFHFERDRNRFCRSHSALRQVIARYLSINPAEVRFEYSARGKPQLAADQNPPALTFNVSHSADVALIAFASKHPLGIDIEKVRSDVDTSALAERFFSPRERDGLRELPSTLRLAGFYACWTRKEAFLKATGDGLAFPLGDFSVTTNPEAGPAVEEIRGDAESAKQWSLLDLTVDGYRAALAIHRTLPHLEAYAWN